MGNSQGAMADTRSERYSKGPLGILATWNIASEWMQTLEGLSRTGTYQVSEKKAKAGPDG